MLVTIGLKGLKRPKKTFTNATFENFCQKWSFEWCHHRISLTDLKVILRENLSITLVQK